MGIAAIGGCAAAASNFGYSHFSEPQLAVEQVQIPLQNLPASLEGLKIVQLSDIHLHPYTHIEFVQQAIARTNALKPDLIVLTGDYVQETAESIDELAPALAALDARLGVFSIIGNHDIWTNVKVVRAGFEQARLPLLHNQGVMLGMAGANFYLAGVDDGWSGQPDLKAALAGRTQDVPTILLAHEPDLADKFALDGRISLQLSGHTHGGQVRLPGFGAPVLPYLGRKYDQGLYKVNNMWLYTNRGLGLIVPIRVNCSPEITEITLIRA